MFTSSQLYVSRSGNVYIELLHTYTSKASCRNVDTYTSSMMHFLHNSAVLFRHPRMYISYILARYYDGKTIATRLFVYICVWLMYDCVYLRSNIPINQKRRQLRRKRKTSLESTNRTGLIICKYTHNFRSASERLACLPVCCVAL